MNISLYASILAGICFVISSILYVRDTATARIKPSIATFGILSLVNFSQLISLISKHVWHVVPFTTVGFLQALAVFIIALQGKNFYFKQPINSPCSELSSGLLSGLLLKMPHTISTSSTP